MKAIFTFIFWIFTLNLVAQSDRRANYILVRFTSQYDHFAKREYYTLRAESGSDSAGGIYTLLHYNNNKNVLNTQDVYEYNKKDSTGNLFNYFLTPTEGLNYLAKKGWRLLSAFTETFSGYNNERTSTGELVPVPTVSSRPVYCFVKD